MHDNQQRIDEFKTELAALRTKSSSSATADRRLLALGVLLMVAGVAAILAGYWGAANTLSTPEAISYLISGGVLGMALVLIGVALFLRYSMAGFLKFWLVRWVYELQAQTDRVIATVDPEAAVSDLRRGDTVVSTPSEPVAEPEPAAVIEPPAAPTGLRPPHPPEQPA